MRTLALAPRIEQSEVGPLAAEFDYWREPLVEARVAAAQRRGFLSKEDLVIVGEWKSVRIRPRIAKNTEDEVNWATQVALATSEPRLALHVLLALHGVGMPMGSTILYHFHPEHFPIVDRRALWTLGVEEQFNYSLDHWQQFVEFNRELANRWDVSKKTLDRALWKYSEIHQERLT